MTCESTARFASRCGQLTPRHNSPVPAQLPGSFECRERSLHGSSHRHWHHGRLGLLALTGAVLHRLLRFRGPRKHDVSLPSALVIMIRQQSVTGPREQLGVRRRPRFRRPLTPPLPFPTHSLKKFNPRVWLPTCTVAWGITATLQALIKNEAGFLTARFFMGVSEAGLFRE